MIQGAIDSVNGQTYQNVEHIFIDGNSIDATCSIIKSSPKRPGLLKIYSKDGLYNALNKGVRLSTGDIIGFLHSDDRFSSRYVLEHIATSFEQANLDVIYGDLVYVKKDAPQRITRYWRAGNFSPLSLKLGWMPPHPTLYLTKSVYQSLGVYNSEYEIAADYEFILRLFSISGLKIKYIESTLIKMMSGGVSNKSLFTILKKTHEDIHIARRSEMYGVFTVFCKNIRKLEQFKSHHLTFPGPLSGS